jgi:hypothetical protein
MMNETYDVVCTTSLSWGGTVAVFMDSIFYWEGQL